MRRCIKRPVMFGRSIKPSKKNSELESVVLVEKTMAALYHRRFICKDGISRLSCKLELIRTTIRIPRRRILKNLFQAQTYFERHVVRDRVEAASSPAALSNASCRTNRKRFFQPRFNKRCVSKPNSVALNLNATENHFPSFGSGEPGAVNIYMQNLQLNSNYLLAGMGNLNKGDL